MLIVQDKLVSDDVVEEHFMCNLRACKGACCWEGDFGAPLEYEEIQKLSDDFEKIKPFLEKKGQQVIQEKGLYVYYEEPKENGTPLLENGSCAYLTYEGPIAKCGIEKAHEMGVTAFKKPISCHLYPIRINKDENLDFEAVNYDKWDICSAACVKGKNKKVRVYQFAKDAIIRKYGKDFYDELDAAASHINKKPDSM